MTNGQMQMSKPDASKKPRVNSIGGLSVQPCPGESSHLPCASPACWRNGVGVRLHRDSPSVAPPLQAMLEAGLATSF